MKPTWSCEFAAAIAVGVASGCAGDVHQDSHLGDRSSSLTAEAEGTAEGDVVQGPGAEEIVVRGRRFTRQDLVSAEQWQSMLDPANLALVESPVVGDASTESRGNRRDEAAIRRLAIQLMTYMDNGVDFYVEAEPNLELAERALYPSAEDLVLTRPGSDEQVTLPTPPVRKKGILGNDDRFQEACLDCPPASYIGFPQNGGTGTLINPRFIYTAAHLLWDNLVTMSSPQTGWICFSGAVCTSAQTARPAWRFVNGLACNYSRSVTNTWVNANLTGNNGWGRATWDFGSVQLNCDQGLGYMGLRILSSGTSGWNGGYPLRFPCPAGSTGAFSDCPAGALQYNQLSPPYSSATLYWNPMSSFVPGDEIPNRTWRGYLDLTVGMSGAPLTDDVARIVGVAANIDSIGASTNVNRFNRLETTVYNWLVSTGL